jgi:antitoxin PrlF
MAYTLTTKSQVTLPKPIRDHLKVAPGDAVEFRIVADGSVRVQPARAVPSKAPRALVEKFRKLQGIGGHAGGSTDALMSLLRGYDEDATDPGFAPPAPPRRARK